MLAVAVHLAALGFAAMAGELEESGESMKRPIARYASELARGIAGGVKGGARRARGSKRSRKG
jgi:hypothetical protein